jgi:hypothetical protein
MPLLNVVLALLVVGLAGWFVNTHAGLPENIRPILNVVLGLIVVGVALWLINVYIPMADSIKAILNIVVVVATCVLVLQTLGLWDSTVKASQKLVHRAATVQKDPPAEAPTPAKEPLSGPAR